MNFHWIDWVVVYGFVIFFILLVYTTKKFTRSAADFLAANRCAGRYLLTLAEGVAGLGAVTIIAQWQLCYKSGLSSTWWNMLSIPVGMIMMMSGWIIYRYREMRVLTMAQFFEIRYSRKFRIFAAIICWVSGIINFGVFPAISASFFISYCGLPSHYQFVGLIFSTYQTLIVLIVCISIYFTFIGGQISVLITDFFQSFFCNIVLLTILILLLMKFHLRDVFDGLLIAEKGKSMVNPFDAGRMEFNPWYFIIAIIGTVFNRLSWQGTQAFNCSAKSPHEAKMAGVISGFRAWGFMSAISLIPLVGYMIMHHPNYYEAAQHVQQMLGPIENAQVRDQMLIPMTMTLYMPVGLVGAFAAMIFIACISTHAIYLHSWGSIFIQDVIAPLRGKPFTNEQHIWALRLSILFVGIFICVFSFYFRQTQHIFYFFALTGAIWLGGIGAAIIGGLYTRWGNTLGAYVALISGSVLATSGIICDQMWVSWYGKNFFLNGQEIYFFAMIMASISYVACSLFSKRTVFNLDKMLHRGPYKIASKHDDITTEDHQKFSLKRVFGITEELTLGDKTIYGISIGYSLLFFVLFVVVTIVAYLWKFSDRQWSNYHYYIWQFTIITSFGIAIWLSVGGVRDMIRFISDLRASKQDFADDGRVENSDDQKKSQNHKTLIK